MQTPKVPSVPTKPAEAVLPSEKQRLAELQKRTAEYEGIEDFMKNIEEHKAFHAPRIKLKEEGWDDLVKQYGAFYVHEQQVEREYRDKYNIYSPTTPDRYWATKESDKFYSQSLFKVLKETIINICKNKLS